MNKYPDFWHVIIGNLPPGAFLAYLLIAYICAFALLLIEASSRDISSTNTPVKFSWRFLVVANLLRIIVDILLLPVFIRLVGEYASHNLMLFAAIGLGFGADALAMIAKNMGILTTNKLAKSIAEKVGQNDPTVTPNKVDDNQPTKQ